MAPRRDPERTRPDFVAIAFYVVFAALILLALMVVVPILAAFY